jgi:peptidoglycan/LPS O-acetylase OafA/YrhL
MGLEHQASTERFTLRPLTGLRFLAALGVLLFHFWSPLLAEAPAALQNVVHGGHVGVSLFFVLSGFILAYTYGNDEGRLTTSRRQFWVARFARVYPLYLGALILDLPHFYLKWVGSTLHEGPLSVSAMKVGAVSASTLGLVQSWTPGIAYLWNAPAWSVSVEAFFYAVFPFLSAAVLVRNPRSACRLVLGLWLVAIVPAVVAFLGEPWFATREDRILWDHSFGAFPLFRLPEFLIGVIAGQQFVRSRTERETPAATWQTVALWLSGAVILGVLALSSVIPQRLLHNGLLAPAFAVLVYCLARDTGIVGRLLGSRLLVLLGEASFAVYILQVPTHALARAIARAGSGAGVTAPSSVETSPAFILIYSALLIVASVAALKLVEQPARRWLRKQLAPRTSARAVEVFPGGAELTNAAVPVLGPVVD